MSTDASQVFVFAYDTLDDARRLRLARLLLSQGERVQRSVFELALDEAARTALLVRATHERCFDPQRDSLRCYALCPQCRGQARTFGATAAVLSPNAPLVF